MKMSNTHFELVSIQTGAVRRGRRQTVEEVALAVKASDILAELTGSWFSSSVSTISRAYRSFVPTKLTVEVDGLYLDE